MNTIYDKFIHERHLLTGAVIMLTILFVFLPVGFSEQLFDQAQEIKAEMIGMQPYGTIEVYEAPFKDSDQYPELDLSKSFIALRKIEENGIWLFVEYDTDKCKSMTGWINIQDGGSNDEEDIPPIMDTVVFSWWNPVVYRDAEEYLYREDDFSDIKLPYSAKTGSLAYTYMDGWTWQEIPVVDDVRGARKISRTIYKDRKITLLEKFDLGEDGVWDYIYYYDDYYGKRRCGFIQDDFIREDSSVHIDHGEIYIHEGVEVLGKWHTCIPSDYVDGYMNGGQTWGVIHYGMSAASFDDLPYDFHSPRGIHFPSTLRIIAEQSWMELEAKKVEIPEGVEYCLGCAIFPGAEIDELVLPSTLRYFETCTLFTNIQKITVSADNPWYKSDQGVLYSKDGKRLIQYPNYKQDLHYDVLPGTKEIADRAFYSMPFYMPQSDMLTLPLTSLSLPIGLEKIGRESLAGCVNLIRLVIPPTVKNIEDIDLTLGVTLSQLSIPEELDSEIPSLRYNYRTNLFEGDNGGTRLVPVFEEDR